MKQAIAVLLSVSLLWGTAQAQPTQSRTEALKQQLIEAPTGSAVEVRLMNKQKLQGKLGVVTDTGFDLQSVREGQDRDPDGGDRPDKID